MIWRNCWYKNDDNAIAIINKDDFNVNYQDPHAYRTALHNAACLGRNNVVKAILNREPDTKLTDYKGRTAQDLAIFKKHTQCAKLIEEYEKKKQ